ncbi:MAG: hypothetical protein CMI08_13350 [Oceanospirillaceae bacterium]|uniref:DUF3592 domain-containing protein n=2 Tax=unclassified Thalassolituus TaxID=2624967 RepID=UPI000C64F33B|nr:DUF3592 domain-containing protein [Thalassolituus sp. UBA6592]MAY00158.1 hypothetical protein [Oceanospirillaceae bacterium]MBL33926.1 hypothetical protein [Oceanospirillaceae bacterium]MBS54273.1 hypothetical protein [Oceanospirillaceae bacterium]|tara:strand:- start:7036 stop:8859 length:1824 start_codon:yes stop_codon:yes gene_type:complete
MRSGRQQKPGVKQRRGGWFIVVFGGIFLLAGLAVIFFMALSPLLKWYGSQSWLPVSAQIEMLELDSRRSDNSDTYRVNTRYRFDFNGASYSGSDASLYDGYDNIGSYWQELYSDLKRHKQSNSAVVWVNPQNPDESVLDRSIRPVMLLFSSLFGLVFALAGAGIIWFGRRSGSKSSRYAALSSLADAGGHEATAARAAFSQGIRSSARSSYRVMMVVGIPFILISLPIMVAAIPDALRSGDYAVLLVLIFPLTGAGMVFGGLRMRSRFLRIGATPFFCDPLPGCCGGQVGGYFEVNSGRFSQRPEIRLCCIDTYTTGSGKNRSTHHRTVWQESVVASVDMLASGQRLRAVFDVPDNLPESEQTEGCRGTVSWEIQCEGLLNMAGPGAAETMEFSRSWEVPVVRGQQRSSWQPPVSQQAQDRSEKQQRSLESAARQISTTASAGGLSLDSAAGRNKAVFLPLLPMGFIFAAVGVFLTWQASLEGGALWVMGPVFALIGGLLFVIGVFVLGRGLECQIEGRQVTIVRRMFGKPLYSRSATIRSPQQIHLDKSVTATSGKRQTDYYRLKLHSDDGKKLTLAEGIAGRDAAEALRQRIVEQLSRELDEELT